MKQHSPSPRRLKLPTFNGGGLQSGLDLDNSADMLDVMDGIDGAD